MKTLPTIMFLAFAWLAAPGAHATGTSNNSIPNYTGILIVTGGVLPSVQVRGDYTVNNFSTTKSLSGTYRVAAEPGGPWKWRARTPAMAAGLTDHRWTMHELLSQPIPLPPWVTPKRRGRPPKRIQVPQTVPA